MKKTKLLAATAMLLLTSCSPKVVTNIVRTYPDIIPADSVYVIGLGEKVPNTAETIGRVSVVDGVLLRIAVMIRYYILHKRLQERLVAMDSPSLITRNLLFGEVPVIRFPD